MRHGKKIHKLERPKAHRVALISNLATALITHGRIKTTESKAKALKPVVDRLITTAKQNTVHARRLVAKTIKSKETLHKLFDEIVPEMIDRTSGYSRILRVGTRRGDAAQVVLIELVSSKQHSEKESSKKDKKKSKAKAAKQNTEKEVVESKPASEPPKAESETKPEDTEKNEPDSEEKTED